MGLQFGFERLGFGCWGLEVLGLCAGDWVEGRRGEGVAPWFNQAL